jgi:hypothetical protein
MKEKRTTKIEDTSISPFKPVFGFAEKLMPNGKQPFRLMN